MPGFKILKGSHLDFWVDHQHPWERNTFPEELYFPDVHTDVPSGGMEGPIGTSAAKRESFVYLDVGAWIGSRTQRWRNWGGYRRDFGIVCGPHILLCAFSSTNDHNQTPDDTPGKYIAQQDSPFGKIVEDEGWAAVKGASAPAIRSIAALLDELGKADAELGAPIVVRYLLADADPLIPAKESDWLVHIIVGDMHLPVVDDAALSLGKRSVPDLGPQIAAYNDWARARGIELDIHKIKGTRAATVDSQLLVDLIPAEVVEDPLFQEYVENWLADKVDHWYTGYATDQAHKLFREVLKDERPLLIREGKRVPRLGRIDLGPLRMIMAQLAPDPGNADFAKDIVRRIETDYPEAAKEIADRIATTKSLAHGLGYSVIAFYVVWMVLADLALGTSGADREKLIPVLYAVLGDLRAWRDVQDVFGILTDTMTEDDAKEWHEMYRNPRLGTSSQELMPPADISEDAGRDFASLSRGVVAYLGRADKDSSLHVAKFHQLGDMIDLWMGFSCHYGAGASNYSGVVDKQAPLRTDDAQEVSSFRTLLDRVGTNAGDRSAEFLKTWVNSCLGATVYGKNVATAVESLIAAAGGDPTKGGKGAPEARLPSFLAGNHDNYLGAAGMGDAYYDGELGRTTLPARRNSLSTQGIWLEHGHQWEDENRDDAPLVPLSRVVVGTDSPMGVFLTQAAFFRPEPSRDISDVVSAARQKVLNPGAAPGSTYPQRLVQIAAAAEMAPGKFYCYAMGHTHSACLCRVVISGEAPSASIDEYQRAMKDDPPRVELAHTEGSPQFGYSNVEFKSTSLAVQYWNLFGMYQQDWLSLEAADSAPGNRIHGLWRYLDGPQGTLSFSAPPGAYIMRYYLYPADTEDVPMAAASPVYVWGAWIEPLREKALEDEGPIPAAVFTEGQLRDIWLRWALDRMLAAMDYVAVLTTAHESSWDGDKVYELTTKGRPYLFLEDGVLGPLAARVPLWRTLIGSDTFIKAHLAKGGQSTQFAVTFLEINRNEGKGASWRRMGDASFMVMSEHSSKSPAAQHGGKP